jgi:ribose/xylose/arabinose/galactoside ABC-type transport system permease subunit
MGVVLGGCRIVDRLSNVPGIWAAALLLTLLITLVNVAHLGAGAQDVVQGVLIVLVLTVGGTKRQKD